MARIGLLYVRGSLPCYENFGYLPTDLVREPRDLDRVDMLIIPPGNIVETRAVSQELAEAIIRFAEDGGLVLGICSGLHLLSREVDTGIRRIRCLGLIDAVFRRLIALDWAEIEIVESTWLTRGLVGRKLRGLHIHTYGYPEGDARCFMRSVLPRHNYFYGPITIASGFVGRKDSVLGMLPHLLLDLYPELRENILRELGVSDERPILERNKELRRILSAEIGVDTGIRIAEEKPLDRCKRVIAVVSGESGEGKTFIATGIVGTLRRLGYRVSIAKLGSDLRDVHPALYLLKTSISPFMGIAIAGRRGIYGWTGWREAIRELLGDSDILVIEGVMGLLTGYSRRCGCEYPCSTLEFLECSRIPTILVVSCSRGGIEDAVERAKLYVSIMRRRGVDVLCIALNEFYGDEQELEYVKKNLSVLGVEVYTVPKTCLGSASIPEVDLDIHTYAITAMEIVSRSIPVEHVINSAPCIDLELYSS